VPPTTAIAVHLPAGELEAVRSALAEAEFEVLTFANSAELESLLRRRPDVALAVYDGEADFDATIEMYAVLHDVGRQIASLIVVAPATLDRLNLGGQARFSADFVVRPYSPESMRWRVEALLIRAQTKFVRSDVIGGDAGGAALRHADDSFATGARRGRVVVVFNPKGGVGKTTLALNTAALLQLRKRERVLLLDCDTVTGHVLPSLGMAELRTVADIWAADKKSGINRSLSEMARFHKSGIRVLAMAQNPLHTEVLEPARVVAAIRDARYSFDWIITDLHPDYGPLNQGVFGLADMIVVPVTPDVPCIRAAIQFREIAADLEIKDRLAIVVNRANSGIGAGDVEKILALPSLARVRSAGMLFVRAANNGHSAIEENPKDKVVADVDGLVDKLIEARDRMNKGESPWRPPSGGLRGLFGRLSAGDVPAR
jgi:Flp pilus assembly CpaE family ATPase